MASTLQLNLLMSVRFLYKDIQYFLTLSVRLVRQRQKSMNILLLDFNKVSCNRPWTVLEVEKVFQISLARKFRAYYLSSEICEAYLAGRTEIPLQNSTEMWWLIY